MKVKKAKSVSSKQSKDGKVKKGKKLYPQSNQKMVSPKRKVEKEEKVPVKSMAKCMETGQNHKIVLGVAIILEAMRC